MMEKEFLVKCNESQKIISVKATDDLVSVIKNTFVIKEADVILQNYDKEWDDWIDVSDFDKIPNRTVLRCISLKPSSDQVSAAPSLSQSTEESAVDSDATEILESDLSTDSEEMLDVPNGYLKGKWPNKFPIDEMKFSQSLKEALKNKVCLMWNQKRELLDVIAKEIQKYTDSPSKIQRHQIALELISKYPHLRETLGSGTDGWQERIKDKMKNIRRNKRNNSTTTGCRRKRFSPPALATMNKKAKRGEVNWSPDIPDEEDDESLNEHLEKMSKEFKKATPNIDVIRQRMKITYAQRRKFINTNPLIFDIKEKYPALFTVSEIGHEFKRLTDTELHKTFMDSLEKAASNILSIAKSSKRASQSSLKYMHTADKKVAALMLLPHLLGNQDHHFIEVFERETTRDYITDKPKSGADPFVAIVGDVDDPKCCYIVAEKVIVLDTPSVITAASTLFGFFFVCNIEYPKSFSETFIFIQKCFMQLCDKSKTPRKVVTFVEKLKM
ncbi:uncharacterized protein LOC117101677 [Anneissia japonica]|uniref:uncharacterized protein LOC117101677 n=1 Tax=Anneissia japonica TaxID=1529436 RepID=UPI0014259878|nr:uncharacterized protein LOC117101677 [Anneissia japonica]